MQLNDLRKINIWESPGVYFFKKGKDILYIGKATNLRDRVRSYFSSDLIKSRGLLLVDMVSKADTISFEKTSSVLEALLLETELIKNHQPYYNTAEKDNKSYVHVAITNDTYPAVITIRQRELEQVLEKNPKAYLKTFGPFMSYVQLKEALRITRRIFPYRDEKCRPLSGRQCFNAGIGLCPGVCVGSMTEKEYKNQIKKLILFLTGKTKKVIILLNKDMQKHIAHLEFEEADKIKKQIYGLGHIQDLALIKREKKVIANTGGTGYRMEAYDVAHMQGKSMVGVMVVMENGELHNDQYRKFILRGVKSANDPAALKEILTRRFNHPEWQWPDVIVVDGNEVQQSVALKVLKTVYGNQIENTPPVIVSVVKDEKHKARALLVPTKEATSRLEAKGITKNDIYALNAEAHRFAITYFRKKQRKDVYL